MFRVMVILTFFLSFPALMISIAFGSRIAGLISCALGLLAACVFLFQARGIFFKSIHAFPLPEESEFRSAVETFLKNHGPEKIKFRLWQTPSPDPVFRIWVGFNSEIEFIFSQGLIARVKESELEALLLTDQNYARIRLENRLYALTLRWESLKGPSNRFQYWLVSFFLYPLEQILKISKL